MGFTSKTICETDLWDGQTSEAKIFAKSHLKKLREQQFFKRKKTWESIRFPFSTSFFFILGEGCVRFFSRFRKVCKLLRDPNISSSMPWKSLTRSRFDPVSDPFFAAKAVKIYANKQRAPEVV